MRDKAQKYKPQQDVRLEPEYQYGAEAFEEYQKENAEKVAEQKKTPIKPKSR